MTTLEGFVRASGIAMGSARDAFGPGGAIFPASTGIGTAPPAPPGGAGRGDDAAAGDSQRVDQHVSDLAAYDAEAAGQLDGATAASRAGRGRMDGIIAAAVADVHALGLTTDTLEGQAALIAAIKRHLEDTQGTLDGAAADAGTRAAAAATTTAGYQGTASGVAPAAPLAGGMTPAIAPLMAAASPLAGAAGAPMSMLSGVGQLAGLPTGAMAPLASLASVTRSDVPEVGTGGQVRPGVVPGGDLPAGVGDENRLQRDTIAAKRAISAAFPQITDIGGYRPDSLPWHPSGKAIDVMIPDPLSARGKATGDAVLQFVLARERQFDINHVIWQNRIYFPGGESRDFGANWGDVTNAHRDHVHVATNGGGYPSRNEVYRI